MKKLISERISPKRIDLNNKDDKIEKRKRTVIITNARIVTIILKAIKVLSFFIISGFLNRFNKIIQACEDSKKCKNYC
jgi:hypothetical protein